MPPKPKGVKIRWNGGGSLVDQELDAVDYADNYETYEEKAAAKPKPSTKPPPAPKLKEDGKPKPKPVARPGTPPPPKEEEILPFQAPPVLETFDDWEAAMDALDKQISYEEEQKAKQRLSKK